MEFVPGESSASDPTKQSFRLTLESAGLSPLSPSPGGLGARSAGAAPFPGLAAPRPDLLPCPRRRDSYTEAGGPMM